MKIVFKDYNGNQVCNVEVDAHQNDLLIIEAIPKPQPRDQREALIQMLEQPSIFPRMKIYAVSDTEV